MIQKKLVTDEDFGNKRKLAEEQKQRGMEEKKQKKARAKARNCRKR